jgi:mycofactocin precursor
MIDASETIEAARDDDAVQVAPETLDPNHPGPEPAAVEADLLIEDVSIDGMCGVY